MNRYVRRPPPAVEAVQVRPENDEEIKALPGVQRVREGHYVLRTDHGPQIVAPGSWFCRYEGTPEDAIFALSDGQFRATYEEEGKQ